MTVSDEGGKLQKLSLDAQGKLVSRVKMKGATPLLTEYRRDPNSAVGGSNGYKDTSSGGASGGGLWGAIKSLFGF